MSMSKELSMIERENFLKINREIIKLKPHTERSLGRIAGVVSVGARVALEGTPLYLDQPWEENHEFGTNSVLGFLDQALEIRSCRTEHVVLLDDYTTQELTIMPEEHLQRMRVSPSRVVQESEFVDQASEDIRRFQERGELINVKGVLVLSDGRQPIVRTRRGRPSCGILDAEFQRSKDCDVNVIVHPKQFRRQQEDMRMILSRLENDRLPFQILNIFFKGENISQAILTDETNNTLRLKF